MAQGILERFDSSEEESRLGHEHAAAKLRVAMPGIIMSFDETEQTATVQPAITENIRLGQDEAKPTPLPLLTDVPVCFPRVGGYCLTFPVKEGDECLLVFSDMCIDGWWQSGGVQDQVETRRHDLSDAQAILGITSVPQAVTGYSTDSLMLRNEDRDSYFEIVDETKTINIICEENINATAQEKINIDAKSDINIEANDDININTRKNWNVKVQGDADVSVKGNADISVQGNTNITINGASSIKSTGAMTIESGTSIKMTAPQIHLN